MSKGQIGLIVGIIGLFGIIYFGCETKPKDIQDVEKSRSLEMEATGIQNILRDARKDLSAESSTILEQLQRELKSAEQDSAKVPILEQISGTWYELNNATLSGYYAEEVAKIQKDEQSWSIAGTSYAIGAKMAQEQKVRDFSTGRAIKAFEKAISINTDNVSHRVNMAISYVDNPMGGSPMRGILMLRDLNEKYPENTSVLNNLGRLAIQTNQIDKAIERLSTAIGLEPNNQRTSCLLAEAYSRKGDAANAEVYRTKCEMK